jgi:hypothetical protein
MWPYLITGASSPRGLPFIPIRSRSYMLLTAGSAFSFPVFRRIVPTHLKIQHGKILKTAALLIERFVTIRDTSFPLKTAAYLQFLMF